MKGEIETTEGIEVSNQKSITHPKTKKANV